MAKHALLSASGSERWMNCTASARLEEDYEDTSSVYAEEGTLAHSLGELMLKKWLGTESAASYRSNAARLRGHELYYKGMAAEVEEYVSYVQDKANVMRSEDKATTVLLEQRVDFSAWVPEGFGTGDCIIVNDEKLEIIDLKFGKGVEVSAYKNPQLMLYALGAIAGTGFVYDFTEVHMTIAQVRLGNFDTYTMTRDELLEWGTSVVKPLADQAYKGEGDPSPGDWCRWCRHRRDCQARSDFYLKLHQENEDFKALTIARLADVLQHTKEIQKWAKEMEEYALDLALDGDEIPGWKVVEGRSNRRISDPEDLLSRLLEHGYKEEEVIRPKEIQTITFLEKLLGKKQFGELAEGCIIKPEGKPTLVVETDKRPALNAVENDFEFN